MKKIMIDIDDTICTDGTLKMVNEFLEKNLKIEDIQSYYIQDSIPREKLEAFYDYYFSHNVYDYADIKEDAIEIIEKLSHEYEIYIASSYLLKGENTRSGILVQRKHEWLLKTLPFIDPSHYIFTASKELINCDIKIDDLLKNLKGNAETKLLFTSYNNSQHPKEELDEAGVIRVNNWKDIEKILLNN
ncbi:MAG: 5' nucleotidase, NT5C type [Ignavibacteriales bacterium]